MARWLGVYAEAYPGFGERVTPAKCEAFASSLEDIELPVLDEAMRRAVRQCKRFPTPAEIREIAGVVAIERRKAAVEQRRKRLEACSRCDGLGFVPDPADPNTSRLCSCRSDRAKRSAAKALLVEGATPDEERDETIGEATEPRDHSWPAFAGQTDDEILDDIGEEIARFTQRLRMQ